MSRFGALLRRLRLDTGMTQQQLEERSGVSVRAISRLEAGHGGNPRVNTVRLLADALPLEAHEREELLATATGAGRRETGGGLVPQQLPARPGAFVGRRDALAALDEAAMISTISGGGGMGKTWLALYWAHRNLDRFPDGQLYLDLRGHGDKPVDPAEAMRGLLTALGVDESAVPAGLDARTGLYRSLTTGKKMLVLLDDARDTDQVSPLLPGSSTCTVVVTSRDNLAGLVAVHGASPIALEVLNATESRHVLTRRLGRQRLAAEPAAVGDILACCGGLPLALGVVAARAVLRPDAQLAAVAAELRAEVDRLDTANPGPDRPLNGHRLDGVPVPRQLPSAIRDFTGRAEPLAALDALVAAESDANSAVITAIDGTAGVGKPVPEL
nr:XRE family transcriptional regulator [Kibdelosporangium sp. MJ126-NF4]CEL22159.1 transcriptional regulator, SARP family [Kibdelosporangium sp. MJ126-NF4]CTQ92940.1 transcriptional regulator, SARP family [Kibdelosporangium sp. MJ126-NF4]